MKAVKPPSSITDFSMFCPARAATDRPADTPPFNAKPLTRGSSITLLGCSCGISRSLCAPSGAPASRNNFSNTMAHCRTHPPCLKPITVPAADIA